MSDKLYSEIVKNQNVAKAQEENLTEITWLVFMAGQEYFAIDSNLVREILRNNEIYQIPFAPSYVNGILNCYGTPYAVIDIEKFLNGNNSESKKKNKLFLILKDKSNLSLQINEIQEFHTRRDVSFHSLADTKDSPFFTGTVSFKGLVAPILNADAIIEKIGLDLENG